MDKGERLKAMRKALGISTEETAKRSRGLLDRRRVEKIESGQLKLQSVRQREGLAHAYGLSRSEIDALIEGHLSVETAIAIARGKSLEVRFPDSRANGDGPRDNSAAEDLGERMGSAIAFRAADLAQYPNLEFCIEYHRRNGKSWDAPVIAAARAGQFGGSDLPTTGAWERQLDRLQAIMRHASLPSSEITSPKALDLPRKETEKT